MASFSSPPPISPAFDITGPSVRPQLPLTDDLKVADAVTSLTATDPKPLSECDGDEISPRQRVKALVEKTLAARPHSDAKLLEDAFAFACEKHAPQKRMTGEPYIEHPIAVGGILAELGMDDVTIAAGLLHDVPEDCNVSYEEMQERFGADVAHLVEGVTKLKHIRFDTKADKQAGNLRKLFLAMAGDVRVIIVKLADRLHNMRTLDPFEQRKKIEISEETLYIFAPIAHRLGIWRIKWELEDRSFKYLEPDVYKQIYSLVQRKRDERTEQVQHAITSLQERLHAEGIEAEVVGRPKHFYSIYQKMIKQGLKFDAIHDLIALRVITPTVPDCYHSLGVVHALWMQVPEMFFDYIAKPKPNNYQSLHTKVLDSNGELLEVQIRTREMHRDAEFGIAAHWRYKAEQGEQATEKAFSDRLRWLRPVLESQQENSTDTQGFLDSLRVDLSAEQVFCFTPHGDVIYLPLGSTPIDFAYRVHSEIGNKCTSAKVNGRIVPLNHKLHNSDICEIVTSRTSKGPKRGWLEFVVTPHAKARIKAFLRRQNFDENYRYGLQRMEKVARAERIKLPNLVDHPAMQKIAKAMGQKNAAELVAAVGYGEYSPEHVFNRLKPDLSPPTKNDETDGLSTAAAKLIIRRPKSALDLEAEAVASKDMAFGSPGINQGEIEINTNKTDGLSHTLMKCCAPIPGDKIKGYITRGRGISVHRADCANLRNYELREPNRVVPAVWSGDEEKVYQALIAVESNDRSGLLADITLIIAERKININAVNTYPLKHGRARLNLAVTIDSLEKLENVMNALRQVVGVTDVHRV
jgi:guanosine-3',5'-bis(diphosphate) 3'-pyrophosphohydrolase